jgi:hypothetical protein
MHRRKEGDPSLRLKNGSGQDNAWEGDSFQTGPLQAGSAARKADRSFPCTILIFVTNDAGMVRQTAE